MNSSPRPPNMSVEDLGQFYIRDDGSVWQLVAYSAQPTASLVRVFPNQVSMLDHRERVGGVVGAPIFNRFKRLRVEE